MSKEEPTLTITILRPTFLKGKPLEVGKNLTLAKKDALDLVGSNKAKLSENVTADDKEQVKLLEAQLKAGKAEKKKKHPSEIAVVPTIHSGRDVVPVVAGSKNAAKTEAEAKKIVENKAADAKARADQEAKLGKLTNPELQAILDEAQVVYEPNAVKAQLVDLVIQHHAAD